MPNFDVHIICTIFVMYCDVCVCNVLCYVRVLCKLVYVNQIHAPGRDTVILPSKTYCPY